MRQRPVAEEFDALIPTATRLLPAMFAPEMGLWAHKTLLTPDGYRNQGHNALYSAMSLVGILKYRGRLHDGLAELIGPGLDGLCREVTAGSSPAHLGTALWALVLAGDGRAVTLLDALRSTLSPPTATSMELGLALTGLASASESLPPRRDEAFALAQACKRELISRFSLSGRVFRGTRPWRPARRLGGLRSALDGRFTSFASQVYPLHGLAEYVRLSQEPPPEQMRQVAELLVRTQGPKGQWWWFYSVKSGEVIEGYPVYSVHQDGMAFMALAPLQNLGVGEYREPLKRGLAWMFGENELTRSLVDSDPPFISRCIQRRGSDPDALGGMSGSNHLRVILASMGNGRTLPQPDPTELEILRECRPYHLGWLLYAADLVSEWETAE